jgi:hypothetical protein
VPRSISIASSLDMMMRDKSQSDCGVQRSRTAVEYSGGDCGDHGRGHRTPGMFLSSSSSSSSCPRSLLVVVNNYLLEIKTYIPGA